MIDPVFFFFLHFHFHFHFCSTLVFRMPIVLLKDFYLLQRVAQLKHSYVAIYCCCPIVAACARARILDQNPRIDAVKIKTKKKTKFSKLSTDMQSSKEKQLCQFTIFDIEIDATNFFISNKLFRHNRTSIKICSNFVIDVAFGDLNATHIGKEELPCKRIRVRFIFFSFSW